MVGILLVDAMNLAWKAIHAYDLSTSSEINTSSLYGFLNQLSSVLEKRKMKTIVVWDGGYKDRTILSESGISKGIIKKAYKSNRNKFEDDEKLKTIYNQIDLIKEFLTYTDVKQVKVDDEEADDVIATYCEKIKDKRSVLCFTCDKDYYQLLDNEVSILNRLKGEEKIITRSSFKADYGIEPYQWVDVGALAGDVGDCICGVPGCGEGIALDYIKQYTSVFDMLACIKDKLEPLRVACPDLSTQDEIDQLTQLGGIRGSSPNFADCYVNMPYTGVAMAFLRKEIKNIKKIELKFAMYEDRIRLAFKLKNMNREINVPNISFNKSFDKDKIAAFCERFEMKSIIYKMENFNLI